MRSLRIPHFARLAPRAAGPAPGRFLKRVQWLAERFRVAVFPRVRLDGRSNRRWQQVFEVSGLGWAEWDLVRGRMHFSPGWLALLGHSDEAASDGDSLWTRLHGDDVSVVEAALQALDDDHATPARFECRLQRADGNWAWFEVNALVAARDRDGAPQRLVCTLRDIDELRQARDQREQMQRLAMFDELTQLPNRAQLMPTLVDALRAADQDGSLLTVCCIDLDHFKPVNDHHGSALGDRLLAELAARMRRSLRSWAGGDDVVARVGGDAFVLLLRSATHQEARHAVARMLRQIGLPCDLGLPQGPLRITASIGATVYPLDRADPETLLRHADMAMYGAKRAGRNGFLFFDAEDDRRTEARFLALGRLQEALDANEFCLHFQPKVDLRSGRVLGAEGLLRWDHPQQGLVPPAQFLPLIEHTGLALTLGRWVLAQGIRQLVAWQQDGLDLSISLNVSARHLQEPTFADELEVLLAPHGEAVARHLILEVLETAAVSDTVHAGALMQRCRALGVRFALDDFGTGYSTFTYLKRLPLDMLKIDRSFVSRMLEDRQDLAIVEGVIGLSRTFGCAVVAEGVETAAQAQRLIELGCDFGQGHGIAAAMPAALLPPWVRGYAGLALPAA